MNSVVKNIFIRNARIGQQIRIDDQIVKKAGKEAPTNQISLRNGLRVSFLHYEDHDWGRLDSVFMDASSEEILGPEHETSLLILGRGKSVKVQVFDRDAIGPDTEQPIVVV